MSLDESRFATLADGTLEHVADVLDEVLGDIVDVEYQHGVLTITLAGGGQYVVNKHGPMRQIWLSSPVSGASHYDWADGEWRATRSSALLLQLLAEELSAKTGRVVEL
jgi:frataxin